jgi:hypothetical protein
MDRLKDWMRLRLNWFNKSVRSGKKGFASKSTPVELWGKGAGRLLQSSGAMEEEQ